GKPVVLYLHGIEGHSQWFEQTASELNRKGFTVYAPDRRGAGMNRRDRGHMQSYKEFLSDVESFLVRIRNSHPAHPVALWGNCWGAKGAAVLSAEAANHGVSGLLLSS